jgi:outer membrane receptor protein involved in Fe transport
VHKEFRISLPGNGAHFSAAKAISILALAFGIAQPACAQDQAVAQAAEEPAAESSIVVTGSRIQRNGFNAPTPVTVVGGELIQDLGQVNASETLRLIPQNISTQSDATAGAGASPNVGSAFANLRGLNPSRGTRTLTLVNTRRFVPTSDGGAVDLNLIPSGMIKRVEVVTGGASAAYGSDAIAGVVNIILDTELEGFRVQADYGQTGEGDGQSYHSSLTYGTSFASGRGHLVFGGEYQRNKGIGDCAKVRLWCQESWDIFTNASAVLPNGSRTGYDIPGSPTYGQPNFIVGPGSRRSYNDGRGVVRNAAPAAQAARNYRFTEDGKGIVQYDPGKYVSSSLTGSRQGGDGESTFDDSDIQTPVRRWVGYLYGDFELSDAITAYTELTYAQRKGRNTAVTAGPRSTFYIRAVNPFIPDALRPLLNGTSFSLGKDVDEDIVSVNTAKANVFRGLLGLKGDMGGGWTWDAYYQYGQNNRRQDRTNSRVNTPFQFAIDAVRDPATGNIVCAELLKANPNPIAQGCRPLNLIGLGNTSPEAIAYAYRPVLEEFEYTQHVLAGTVQGDVYQGWGAGPIGLAAGGEYRAEKGVVYHGDIPNYTDYAFTFGLDYAGKITVMEGFTELNVPVFKDSAIGDFFELNGAVRYTRNKAEDTISGESKTSTATSWKVSGIYDVFNGLRIRASRSRDIRAAGFRELYLKNVPTEAGSSQGIVDNPLIPGSPAAGDDWTPILNGGSFSLTPEKADTTTLGAIVSPAFIPRLRFSLDWYQIKIKDAVTTLPGQRIVDFCNQFSLFCDRITYGAAGKSDISFVDARQVNLGGMTIRGFDIEVDYTLPLADVGLNSSGSLNLRVLGNHQYDFIVQPNQTVPSVNYAGQSGPALAAGDFNPTPNWIWNAFLAYDDGGFNATLSMRRISGGVLDVEKTGPEDAGYDPGKANSISTNRVAPATYFGLAASYKVDLGGERSQFVELFGTVDNLFNKKPPIAPGNDAGGGSAYPTNPVYFDTFGMRWRGGIRVQF